MKEHRKTPFIPLKSNYPVCILKREKKKKNSFDSTYSIIDLPI